jgi:hypothetical protein
MRSSDSSFAFNESQYSKSVSNAPLYFRSISEPLEKPLDGIVAKPISTKIKIFLNISACKKLTTSHQARFPIMKLFSFTLVALGLAQGGFPHSVCADSKGGKWDRKARSHHYHNQGTAPRPSVPSSPKACTESFYQEQYAEKLGGRAEVTTPGGARCGILTDTHAIEADFADKWAEAVGQSLNYVTQKGKNAGIVLLLKDRGDEKHLERLREMVRHCSMDIEIFSHRAF